MLKGLYHNYWQFGFKTRLYDLLTPWAYRDSIAGCVESLQLKNGERVLDAGCGSGQGFERIINECPGVRYVGMDILEQGLQAGREKASRFNGSIRSSWVRADLGADAPFKGGTFDKILAHFSVYTLSDKISVGPPGLPCMKSSLRAVCWWRPTLPPPMTRDASLVSAASTWLTKKRVFPLGRVGGV